MTARLVGYNEKRQRRRAFCLALALVLQPTLGSGIEDVGTGVSSEAFESFLKTKNINVGPMPTATPSGTSTNSVPQSSVPLSSAPLAQPSAAPQPNTTPSAQTIPLQPVTPPATQPVIPQPVIPSTPPASPNVDPKLPVALKTQGVRVAPESPSLAISSPIQVEPDKTVATVSSQPGVELYQPSDSDDLLEFEWGGTWWEEPHAHKKQLITADPQRVQFIDLEQLVWLSVQYSPAIKAIIKVPSVQRSEEDVARSEFDPRFNARSNFKDTSDPVGNTLTTGGPNRLNEYFWENSVGISITISS